jgi:glycosidase
MAFADIDGFRVDAVKHMDLGATRFLASEFHEFAQTLGKDNFTLIGEITGGRERAFRTLEQTGLDAALGIDDIPDKLEYLIKGYRNPRDYFSLFRNSELVNKDSHTWFRDKVVTVFDDHDQVRKGDNKARFCADPQASELVLNALALNATTLGIPCIYYGTEQGFDGRGGKPAGDRYIREAMFGGEFGAFRSRGRHFFDESNPIYRELARILEIRRSRLVLRRGRQFLRDVSDGQDGTRFFIPEMVQGQIRYAVAWSRILDEEEVVLAINTDYDQDHEVWVTLDARLNESRTKLRCLYSPRASQVGRLADIEARNGRAAKIMVPKAGFVIFEQA